MLSGLKASVDGVDKNFQEIQAASEDNSRHREELQRHLEDGQAKTTAKRNPEVENMRRMVEEAMLNADEEKIMKWKAEAEAEAEKGAAEDARVSALKAEAESANCKAEAAEREAEAARVVMLEAATELEKAAASDVMRTASNVAKLARAEANKAKKAAKKAARNRAAQL